MHTGHIFTTFVRRFDLGVGVVQRHRGGIHDFRIIRGTGHDLRRDQRPRVQTHRAFADDALRFQGQKLGIAGAGTNEIDGHDRSPSMRRA